MRAAYVSRFDADNPLAALTVGEQPDPTLWADDWVTVRVLASSLNHHDLWSLRGVGLHRDRLPMILGCDAVAVDPNGTPVLVYPLIVDPGDPRGMSILSEHAPGTLAERLAVPRSSLLPLPDGMSVTDAACLPTAWLTAWRMLTTKGRIDEADSVLVQGAGGGVATAAVMLAVAMGKRVYATSRDGAKRERIAGLGATALEPGARLPERVDVVIETVGAATFDHSLKSAAPLARIVVSGATAGHEPTVNLRRVFAMQLEILGTSMGTVDELGQVLAFCADRGLRPAIDSIHPFTQVEEAFARLDSGEVFGKVVVDHTR